MEEAGAGPPRSRGEANIPDELVVPGSLPGTALRDPRPPQGPPAAQEAEAGRRQAAGPLSLSGRTWGVLLTDYLSRRPLEEAGRYHHPTSFLGQQRSHVFVFFF